MGRKLRCVDVRLSRSRLVVSLAGRAGGSPGSPTGPVAVRADWPRVEVALELELDGLGGSAMVEWLSFAPAMVCRWIGVGDEIHNRARVNRDGTCLYTWGLLSAACADAVLFNSAK